MPKSVKNISKRDGDALDEYHTDLIAAVNAADSPTAFTAALMMAYLDVACQVDPDEFLIIAKRVFLFMKKRFPETWEAKCGVMQALWQAVIVANLPQN